MTGDKKTKYLVSTIVAAYGALTAAAVKVAHDHKSHGHHRLPDFSHDYHIAYGHGHREPAPFFKPAQVAPEAKQVALAPDGEGFSLQPATRPSN